MQADMNSFRFKPTDLLPGAADMRAEVRAFLAGNLADNPSHLRARFWIGYDDAFSAKVGQVRFLGVACPREIGGHRHATFERYVMLEEMLASGAPVSAHIYDPIKFCKLVPVDRIYQ